MRCVLGLCAREQLEMRANPAKNANIAQYRFIDNSIGDPYELENGCALSVNRLSRSREQATKTTRKQDSGALRIGFSRGLFQS
jgi:hypothetical protein